MEIEKINGMKKSILLLLLIIVASITATMAKSFEGTVTYKVDVIEVKPNASLSPQIIPETVKAYIKGGKIRLEMQTLMTVSLLSDASKQDAHMLVDMFGLKYALDLDTEEWKKAQRHNDRIKIKNTGDRKTIANLRCRKATIYDTKSSYKTDVYYAEGYKMDPIFGLGFDFLQDVNGLPMDFTMQAGGLVMHITATEVQKLTLSPSRFIVPDDYEKADSEQILKLLGIK